MRTGHFSPEKQTVEIRIREQGEGEGGGRESILQLYRAYLRVSPRETIRIISIPRTEGLCNAIGWRRYSAACGHGIELPNSGNACVWRVRLVPLPFLPLRCGLYWQNKISRACPIRSKIFQKESMKEDEGERKRDEDFILRLALMLADCNSLSVIH